MAGGGSRSALHVEMTSQHPAMSTQRSQSLPYVGITVGADLNDTDS
jgi:hypothetical protein